jgi:uncharacterized Fe-S center protein
MAEVFFHRVTYEELLKNPQIVLDCLNKTTFNLSQPPRGVLERQKSPGFSPRSFTQSFTKDEFIALKIHFGEKGNKSHIHPNFLLPLVKFLKKSGTKPFLFETNTLYHGERMNAIDHMALAYNHGFGKLNIPIVIGDGIKGNDCLEVEINKKNFKKCFIAKTIKDIDYLLVLSHFTGHMLTGFGAAIKNLGMGCASRRGKLAQHCEVTPQINLKKCTKCGICAANCSVSAIIKGDSYRILDNKCIGCAQCISLCPVGAVNIIWSEGYSLICEKLAEYALAATKGKKSFYINFCLYITKECDCMNKEGEGFVKDLGLLFSQDPVAIDKASIDLIVNKAGHDAIKEIHPKINYLHGLTYAQSIGLGSLDYQLIEI